MLVKVTKLKNFGIYKAFTWPADAPNFAKFNVIYGWNYTGKTTLSRSFRCLEIGAIHNIEPTDGVEIEFEGADGAKYNQESASKPLVRVFNSDFIKENLKWDTDNKIHPIVLLGEENIELQTKLEEEKASLVKMQQVLDERLIKNKNEVERLGLAATDKAREIAQALRLTNFNKTHLVKAIDQIKPNHHTFLLNEEELFACHAKATSTEQRQKIAVSLPEVANLSQIRTQVSEIIGRQCASESKIEKLLDDIKLSKWVEVGRALHKDKTECEFCGNTFSADLLSKLNSHFSEDYEELKQTLEQSRIKISGATINLISHLPSEADFYKELQAEYKVCKTALENSVIEFNSTLNLLLSDIEKKKDKPFDNLFVSDFIDNQNDVEIALEQLQLLIRRNDEITDKFGTEKITAEKKVIKAYVATFEEKVSYSSKLASLTKDEQEISALRKVIEAQKLLIKDTEARLSDTVKGAEQVNTYLAKYFNKGDILIEPNKQSQFMLMRGREPAKNLSEGEKTAIAFAYFMASLEQNGNVLANTIVYLDDPISSLDANHLFNTYAFIRTHFYKMGENGPDKHKCLCKQLFISTHNFELLNLIKDWFGKMAKTDASYFAVERVQVESKIIKMPNTLLKFKSEYVYLFSIIKAFEVNPVSDFEHLYNLPNIVRRFIETFSAYKFLSTMNIDQNLEKIITNPLDCEQLRKFVHYNSHSLDTTRMLQLPDFSECTSIISILMKGLEAVDEMHYDALCLAVA